MVTNCLFLTFFLEAGVSFFFSPSGVDGGSGQSRQRRVSINEDSEAFLVEDAGVAAARGVREREKQKTSLVSGLESVAAEPGRLYGAVWCL